MVHNNSQFFHVSTMYCIHSNNYPTIFIQRPCSVNLARFNTFYQILQLIFIATVFIMYFINHITQNFARKLMCGGKNLYILLFVLQKMDNCYCRMKTNSIDSSRSLCFIAVSTGNLLLFIWIYFTCFNGGLIGSYSSSTTFIPWNSQHRKSFLMAHSQLRLCV